MNSLIVAVFLGVVLQVGAIQTAAGAKSEKPDAMPVLLEAVDPHFSDEARAKHISASVKVRAFIDEQGHVTDVKVVYGVGYGLDEEAVKAVRQYLFKPALKGGRPVACDVIIQVNFKIADKL